MVKVTINAAIVTQKISSVTLMKKWASFKMDFKFINNTKRRWVFDLLRFKLVIVINEGYAIATTNEWGVKIKA